MLTTTAAHTAEIDGTVAGTGNKFLKNQTGDRGKGNGQAGFLLNGGSTLTPRRPSARGGMLLIT